jgi:hypothetical protein
VSHLMETTKRMAEADPNIQKIKRVGIGNWVVYRGRHGAMRQGRTEFPAVVLKQHEDDGSVDLIVCFEAEDVIWEQRVHEYSEQQQHHCWTAVIPIQNEPRPSQLTLEMLYDATDDNAVMLQDKINVLRQQMYGEYNAPPKSMIEYLDDFDKRLKILEKRMGG